MDRDCDLWIESEGKLTKENQAYGAWIHATLFVKGRSSVLKVPDFYAAKKAQKKKVGEDESVVVLSVFQTRDQPPTVVLVQTEKAANFQGAFNEVTVVSEGEDMISDVAVLESCDSREVFEEKLAEIDKALAQFDKESGVTLGASIEGKNDGNKEESTARRDEAIHTVVESIKEKVGDEMGTTQSREQEGSLVSVPITQLALCDISNVIGSKKGSARVEKSQKNKEKRPCTANGEHYS